MTSKDPNEVENVLDLSSQGIYDFPTNISHLRMQFDKFTYLDLSGNHIKYISDDEISYFPNLLTLDLSSNQLECLPCGLNKLAKLKALLVRNNYLYDLPRCICSHESLEMLNISGNKLEEFPVQVLQLFQLKQLHLGGNRIYSVPKEITQLSRLEYLYLGGNKLQQIPMEMGKLTNLKILNLCDNQITMLPNTLAKLHQLESLSLHNNNLTVLPIAIVKLKNLEAISVRGNPLVIRFVRSQCSSFPTLQELAGKTIKNNRVPYSKQNLPVFLIKYLDSARKCVNPMCRGVFFDSCVRHIKFVDFCGKYRLPFEQFLCSPHDNEQWEDLSSCSSTSSDDDDSNVEPSWMKKVLLG